ncbi:MAG: lipoyl(octanoyl) transferase LipB [Gammaproteobacteria bacterium]|nr:lipoyl(octanoyl) transferase LipB [Gammaproteobacteria bacterium]
MTLALNHRNLGLTPYADSLQAMKDFVAARDDGAVDEIWYVEHPPVFTQGMAGKPEHLLSPGDIPVVQTDRGGQVTYHGPGQIVAYLMIDIGRRQLGVRKLVELIEQAVINLLADYQVTATGDRQAPGVYVNGAKVAALGLRVRKHSTYHGLSLNVDMDLSPFQRINPCGYQGLEVTSLKKLGITDTIESVQAKLHYHLATVLNYQYQPLTHAA